MYFLSKVLVSALIIALVTKLSEKAPTGGALLKSLPLTSFLVFFFMKFEGRTNKEISSMSWDVFFLVIPSLILFIVFPLLLDRGVGFGLSLLLASTVMCVGYLAMFKVLA